MRISCLNLFGYRLLGQSESKNVSHKGLWGAEENRQIESSHYDGGNMCDMGTDHFLTTKTYYPFLNETKEDIEKVCKENNKKGVTGDSFHNVIYETRVDIKETIPVTEQKYRQYVKRELLSLEEMQVEDKLKMAKLQQFLYDYKKV